MSETITFILNDVSFEQDPTIDARFDVNLIPFQDLEKQTIKENIYRYAHALAYQIAVSTLPESDRELAFQALTECLAYAERGIAAKPLPEAEPAPIQSIVPEEIRPAIIAYLQSNPFNTTIEDALTRAKLLNNNYNVPTGIITAASPVDHETIYRFAPNGTYVVSVVVNAPF